MNETELSREASAILNQYHVNELMELFHDVHELFTLYDVDEQDDIELQKHFKDDIHHLRLIKTAIILSRLADNHARRLLKIHRRFGGFWSRALQAAQQDQTQ